MKIIKKYIGIILFYGIGRYLPSHVCPIRFLGKISTKFRYMCGKLILTECGSNVNICKGSKFSSKVCIGNNSGIGIRAEISGECHIGDYVIMGPDCQIWTVNHNYSDLTKPIKYQGNTDEKPVYIGNDVWIGSRVMILPGVHIGNGVVIGGSTVVSKDVPDYAIVVGNPGRVVKFRNGKEV
ncbi:acyltransferase [uncultured Ruminococcus sp.]|uniref:acyltransferase n=1 Tax=uncultured Ruminococcus sp. TaxID=165186 RepID=UPI002619837A|nr:acyltransferase [uncultured Ruminococcus sp.]